MWYLKKVASRCLRPKFITFYFQNLGNRRKDKNGRRWNTFSFDNEKNNSDRFC